MSVQFGSIVKAYDLGTNGQKAVASAAEQGYRVSEEDAVGAIFAERSANVTHTFKNKPFAYAKPTSDVRTGYFIVNDGKNNAPIALSNGLQLLPTAEGWNTFWDKFGGYVQSNPEIKQELFTKLEGRRELASIEMKDEKVRLTYDA